MSLSAVGKKVKNTKILRKKESFYHNFYQNINKMSLTLLLEKYDVSTEEGLQKALSEIELEEVFLQNKWTYGKTRQHKTNIIRL